MVAESRRSLSWSLCWKAQPLLVIFQPLIWADCWGHPPEHQLFPLHWFTPAVQRLPCGSCWSAPGGKEISPKHGCTTRLWVHEKISRLHRAQRVSERYRATCFQFFSPRSSLKGQCVILIIVRYELMKNWYSAPFLSTLVYKAGLAASESLLPKCTPTLYKMWK